MPLVASSEIVRVDVTNISEDKILQFKFMLHSFEAFCGQSYKHLRL